MMKLTKRQRLAAYKYALKEVQETNFQGVCWILDLYCENTYGNFTDILKTFPEFANKKPKRAKKEDYWWKEGVKPSRIKVLEACIEELSPKKKKS